MILARTAPATRIPVPPLLAFASLPVLGSWWWLMHDQVAAVGPSPIAPAAIAWLSVITRVAAWGAEAAVYGMVWASAGVRLPWRRYALALAPLSVLDLCADTLRFHAAAFGEGARAAIAVLGGIGALGPFEGEWGMLGTAFTATGLLTFVRIAGAALVQSRLAGVPWRAAFALTGGLWLAHHVALWWVLELTAGRSLPGEAGS